MRGDTESPADVRAEDSESSGSLANRRQRSHQNNIESLEDQVTPQPKEEMTEETKQVLLRTSYSEKIPVDLKVD